MKHVLKRCCSAISINMVSYGNTALHHAAAIGHFQTVRTLVNCFANLKVDQVNILGQTALMKAAIQGQLKCVKILLEAGADPQKRDFSRNYCPLEWAKYVGRTECAEFIAKFMLEPCKHFEKKLPNASENLKQIACLVAIPIISGNNFVNVTRPRLKSAPVIPILKVTSSEGKFVNPYKKTHRSNSSMN